MIKFGQARIKAFFILLAVLLVGTFCLWGNRSNDYFSHTFVGTDFDLSKEVPHTVQEQLGVLYLDEAEDPFSISADNITLEPGTYAVELQYDAKGAPAQMVIRAEDYLNAEGNCGADLLKAVLGTDESAFYGSFELDKRVYALRIELQVPQQCTFAVARMELTSDDVVYNDTILFSVFLLFFCTVFFCIGRSQKSKSDGIEICGEVVSQRRKKIALFSIFGAAALLAMIPFSGSQLPDALDLPYHLARIESIRDGLSAGQFPVRVHPYLMNGRGYLNPIFYPEIFLYFPALLRLLGMSLFNSYRVFVFAINFATIVVAWRFFEKLLKSHSAALAGAMVYLFSPYRLSVIFDRAAIGEALAMIFFPMVLYGMYAVLWGKYREWPWLVWGISGVCQSHILSAGLVLGVCVIAAAIGIKQLLGQQKRIVPLLKATGLTVAVNLWFIVPFVLMSLQQKMAVFSRQTQLSLNAVSELQELFGLRNLSEYRIYEGKAGLAPCGIGWAALVGIAGFILYLILFGGRKSKNLHLENIGLFLLVAGGLCLLASTSLFPWDVLQMVPVLSVLVGMLQVPYRLLMISGFCFSALCGIGLTLWLSCLQWRRIAAIAVIFLAVLPAILWMEGTRADLAGSGGTKSLTSVQYGTMAAVGLGEYIPMNSNAVEMMSVPPLLKPSSEAVQVSEVSRNGTSLRFNYVCDGNGEYVVELPVTYYPTYTAQINGLPVEVFVQDGNYAAIRLIGSSGYVQIRYTEPTTYRVAEWVSFFTLVGWGIAEYLRRKNSMLFLKMPLVNRNRNRAVSSKEKN